MAPEMVHALPPAPSQQPGPAAADFMRSLPDDQAVKGDSNSGGPSERVSDSSPNVRAVCDRVYELMKRELILSRDRESGGGR